MMKTIKCSGVKNNGDRCTREKQVDNEFSGEWFCYQHQDKNNDNSGRPTDYRKEFAEQAYKLCLLGATDKDMADFFEVTEQTINNWKHSFPKFFESIKRGKKIADANVAESLYKKATGYEHKATKFATHEGKITDTMDYTKHYAPDTTAAFIWLKNRQPEIWRDKQEIEHTGKDGGPIEHKISNMSEEELLQEAERYGIEI